MKTNALFLTLLSVLVAISSPADGEEQLLLDAPVVLRSGDIEWEEFAEAKASPQWDIEFEWRGEEPAFLEWTQYDVKQSWEILLNDKNLASLMQDENRMALCTEIPSGALRAGRNKLSIKPKGKTSVDDIVLEQIRIGSGVLSDHLSESELVIKVQDSSTGKGTPTRITLLREDGAFASHGLLATSAQPIAGIAARIGTVYSLSGEVTLPVPAGKYVVFAGRGFEYSLAKVEVTTERGKSTAVDLKIARVVDTTGYAACDTHIHTLTYSGHGDASIEERMVTVAGEGIELAIATDHNKYINYEEWAVKSGAREYFTPVVGCEVTTPRGHFNVFPIAERAPLIAHQQTNWKELFGEIYQTPDVGVAILNHARDSHSGVRPFAIDNHYSLQGENALGWDLGFNAMEVLNSAATQSDLTQLTRDWMALLNRGLRVAPIGCSDSHDVSRHFVGQGRTYVRCNDRQPGQLDVRECVQAIASGEVLVSYGLYATLNTEGERFAEVIRPASRDDVEICVEVQSPHWLQADRVQLYVNGELLQEKALGTGEAVGMKNQWKEMFRIPNGTHDVCVVAVATGPGVEGNYWRCAKPYQPTSTRWESRVFACSGALWLDRDGNQKRDCARDYALRIIEDGKGNLSDVLKRLDQYDRATAVQALAVLHSRKVDLATAEFLAAVSRASDMVKEVYRDVSLEIRNQALSVKNAK